MSETSLDVIDHIDRLQPDKASLTVPLIASYLSKNYPPVKIAQACGVSRQAVHSYIKSHLDELRPLVDMTDGLPAMKNKHIADKAQGRIIMHLDDTTKSDLIALNMISGTHTQRYLELTGKGTPLVNINISQQRIVSAQERIKELQDKLANG